jgi:hypothetical protein
MKIRSVGFLLIVGATIVAAVRYVGVFAHSEGWLISGDIWKWAVALSGLGMAILEGVAVWYCWRAWSASAPGVTRSALLVLIIAMLVSVGLMVTPYIRAAMGGVLVGSILSDLVSWAWALSVAVSPLVVMAAAGLAENALQGVTVQPVTVQGPVERSVTIQPVTLQDVAQPVYQSVMLQEVVQRPAVTAGAGVTRSDDQRAAVDAWESFQGDRSLRAVASGLGWSHTKLSRVLRSAGVAVTGASREE